MNGFDGEFSLNSSAGKCFRSHNVFLFIEDLGQLDLFGNLQL
jgi:hypothetical protein